jgi:hypothetical protein
VGSEPAFFVCGIEAEVTLKWPGQFGVMGLQVGLKIWLLLEGPLAEVTGEGMGGRLDTGWVGVETWHTWLVMVGV